jgi:carboxypeptidase Taq
VTILGQTERLGGARERFYEWMGVLNDLKGSIRLLDWDRETAMPASGADARARVVATLHALRHRELLRPEIRDDLAALAEATDPDGPEAAMLRLAAREIRRAERVPEALVRETSTATSHAVSVWLEARHDDFDAFAPALERLIALTREMAEAMDLGEEPYDALLDRFEPGALTSELEPFFAELTTRLSGLAARVDRAPPGRPFAGRSWPAATQMAVARDVAALVGFDLDSGIIALSAHPFTGSPHRGDVRFTTRFLDDDPTSNVLVTLHEAGHGLYSQGHPAEYERTLLHWSPSLGAEESQSRFWENHLGRRLAFWRAVDPILRSRFGASMDGIAPEDLHRATAVVPPSWSRMEAGQVTYDLHIALRFRLELALVRGALAVRDLPEAWSAGMEELLGVRAEGAEQGPMQDIHWAAGLIGYFPTYTVGNLYAAQLAEALEEEAGPIDGLIARGGFDEALAFMRERVHRHGSMLPTRELMRRATGRPFSADALLAHLERVAADGA